MHGIFSYVKRYAVEVLCRFVYAGLALCALTFESEILSLKLSAQLLCW